MQRADVPPPVSPLPSTCCFSFGIAPLQPSHAAQFFLASAKQPFTCQGVTTQVNGDLLSPSTAEKWLLLTAIISEPSETVHESPGRLPSSLLFCFISHPLNTAVIYQSLLHRCVALT